MRLNHDPMALAFEKGLAEFDDKCQQAKRSPASPASDGKGVQGCVAEDQLARIEFNSDGEEIGRTMASRIMAALRRDYNWLYALLAKPTPAPDTEANGEVVDPNSEWQQGYNKGCEDGARLAAIHATPAPDAIHCDGCEAKLHGENCPGVRATPAPDALKVVTEEMLEAMQISRDWSVYKDHEKREIAYKMGFKAALAPASPAKEGT
jgi:hypothetical protein